MAARCALVVHHGRKVGHYSVQVVARLADACCYCAQIVAPIIADRLLLPCAIHGRCPAQLLRCRLLFIAQIVALPIAIDCANCCADWRLSVRMDAAAKFVGDGRRRPAMISGRILRRLNFASRFSSGLSRAAHEVFGPIFYIGPNLVDFEIFEILGPKLF
ncbi:pumilio1-like [Dorcoceras hygrometricum]|uniref:Pumilio1-like n=1 Tax=Dorcoceras hygrometricum TaxID=472368 RepID=A0A2Z7C0M7_9LAMI|nr:pumilio1-like [Dorcoceras hygrometricum]